MRFDSTIPAGEHERFGPDAGRSQIGKSIPINRFDGPPIRGTIVDVKPNEDGSALLMTVDTGDSVEEMSFDGSRCGRVSRPAGSPCGSYAVPDGPACWLHITAAELAAVDAARACGR